MYRQPILKKRRFLRCSLISLAIFGFSCSGLGLLYATLYEPANLQVSRYSVDLPAGESAGLDGLRIAQISDIHMGGWMNPARFERALGILSAEKPDVIVISGDLLARDGLAARDAADLANGLKPLAESTPIYVVFGNHDYWHGADELYAPLQEIGAEILDNRHAVLQRGESHLILAGLDDQWEGKDDLDRVLRGIPQGDPAILLAHEPAIAERAAQTGRFFLQLSGHTHGGQVSLPLIGPPLLPWLGVKYPAGWFRVGEMDLYVNRGLGMTKPYVRAFCPPEIAILTLQVKSD